MKGLLAEEIARGEERFLLRVPQDEGEHAPEAVEALPAPFVIRRDDDLGVGSRAERPATLLDLGADLRAVVALAVVGNPVTAAGAGHRLIAGAEIDDAQPGVAERAAVDGVDTAGGGAAQVHPHES